MNPAKRFYENVKAMIFTPEKPERGEAREVIPFFGMVTVAMVWIYVVYVQQIESVLNIILFTVLMVIHVGLYWSILLFIHNRRNMRVYFILQGLLAFVIVSFAGDYGLAIGLYASLIGNVVGALEDKRDLLFFIPGYLTLAVISIVMKSGIGVVVQWSFVAIPSILISGFIAMMFRRQLEMRDKTQTLLDDLQKAHARLGAYAAQVEEMTLVEERQRIARELHDTLAQELTGVVLQLEAVSTHIEKQNNTRAQEILQDAMAQSRVTLAEARKVIDGLRSAQAPGKDFEEAVRQEAARFERVAQIPCEVSCHLSRPLPANLHDHLLKIISEGLNNIAKHAGASQVWLRLKEEESGLLVEIEDDGEGFDPRSQPKGRYGLIGIGERAALLQGRYSIDSQIGAGTRLQVVIPIPGAGEAHE